MPVWLLKAFHFFGLTNLTDVQVAKYAHYQVQKVTFSSQPIVKAAPSKISDRPSNPTNTVTH